MPELPEVEVVRRGLHTHLLDRTIVDVSVAHPRAVRRHDGGAPDLTARLRGARIVGTGRRRPLPMSASVSISGAGRSP